MKLPIYIHPPSRFRICGGVSSIYLDLYHLYLSPNVSHIRVVKSKSIKCIEVPPTPLRETSLNPQFNFVFRRVRKIAKREY